MRKVLATDFGLWPSLQNLATSSDAMVSSEKQWSSLASYILLYDQIVIPTGNFQIIPVLRIMLGEDVFDELVKNNVIVLARYDKWFSYLGNGVGLRHFAVSEGPGQSGNLAHAYFKPLDEAIDIALKLTLPASSRERASSISNLLIDKVIPVTNDFKYQDLRKETYKDVLGSPYLRDFMDIKKGKSLNKLRGVNKNQAVVFSPHITPEEGTNKEIWSLLRVAFENFVLRIGSDAEVNEITGDGSTLAILNGKGQRAGAAIEGRAAFSKIQEISSIPDVGQAFAAKKLSPEQLLDLRMSEQSQVFRNWLAQPAEVELSGDTVERYLESLEEKGFLEKIPTKIIRLVTTGAIGVFDPAAGISAAAFDSLVLPRLFSDSSPKVFLQEVKSMQLQSKPQKVIAPRPKY